MKYLFLLFSLIFFRDGSAQITFKGSYTIAAICKDGIVIGSDSRGSFLRDGKSIATFDYIQKTFIVKNCVISFIGLIALGDKFVSNYIKEFEPSVQITTPPDECLKLFISFLAKYPDIKGDLQDLDIISAGYKDGRPTICFASIKLNTGKCAQDTGIALQSKKIVFGKGTKYDEAYCKKHSCKQVADIIEKAILDFAIKENRKDVIGGKIMAIRITKKDIQFIKNKPSSPRWVTLQQFLKDYRDNKIKVKLLTKDADNFIRNFKLK